MNIEITRPQLVAFVDSKVELERAESALKDQQKRYEESIAAKLKAYQAQLEAEAAQLMQDIDAAKRRVEQAETSNAAARANIIQVIEGVIEGGGDPTLPKGIVERQSHKAVIVGGAVTSFVMAAVAAGRLEFLAPNPDALKELVKVNEAAPTIAKGILNALPVYITTERTYAFTAAEIAKHLSKPEAV